MKLTDADGTPRNGYDMLLALESRYLPLAALAGSIIGGGAAEYDSVDPDFALALGCEEFLADLREVRNAVAELEHRAEKGA